MKRALFSVAVLMGLGAVLLGGPPERRLAPEEAAALWGGQQCFNNAVCNSNAATCNQVNPTLVYSCDNPYLGQYCLICENAEQPVHGCKGGQSNWKCITTGLQTDCGCQELAICDDLTCPTEAWGCTSQDCNDINECKTEAGGC
jgi:hypothetical protein